MDAASLFGAPPDQQAFGRAPASQDEAPRSAASLFGGDPDEIPGPASSQRQPSHVQDMPEELFASGNEGTGCVDGRPAVGHSMSSLPSPVGDMPEGLFGDAAADVTKPAVFGFEASTIPPPVFPASNAVNHQMRKDVSSTTGFLGAQALTSSLGSPPPPRAQSDAFEARRRPHAANSPGGAPQQAAPTEYGEQYSAPPSELFGASPSTDFPSARADRHEEFGPEDHIASALHGPPRRSQSGHQRSSDVSSEGRSSLPPSRSSSPPAIELFGGSPPAAVVGAHARFATGALPGSGVSASHEGDHVFSLGATSRAPSSSPPLQNFSITASGFLGNPPLGSSGAGLHGGEGTSQSERLPLSASGAYVELDRSPPLQPPAEPAAREPLPAATMFDSPALPDERLGPPRDTLTSEPNTGIRAISTDAFGSSGEARAAAVAAVDERDGQGGDADRGSGSHPSAGGDFGGLQTGGTSPRLPLGPPPIPSEPGAALFEHGAPVMTEFVTSRAIAETGAWTGDGTDPKSGGAAFGGLEGGAFGDDDQSTPWWQVNTGNANPTAGEDESLKKLAAGDGGGASASSTHPTQTAPTDLFPVHRLSAGEAAAPAPGSSAQDVGNFGSPPSDIFGATGISDGLGGVPTQQQRQWSEDRSQPTLTSRKEEVTAMSVSSPPAAAPPPVLRGTESGIASGEPTPSRVGGGAGSSASAAASASFRESPAASARLSRTESPGWEKQASPPLELGVFGAPTEQLAGACVPSVANADPFAFGSLDGGVPQKDRGFCDWGMCPADQDENSRSSISAHADNLGENQAAEDDTQVHEETSVEPHARSSFRVNKLQTPSATEMTAPLGLGNRPTPLSRMFASRSASWIDQEKSTEVKSDISDMFVTTPRAAGTRQQEGEGHGAHTQRQEGLEEDGEQGGEEEEAADEEEGEVEKEAGMDEGQAGVDGAQAERNAGEPEPEAVHTARSSQSAEVTALEVPGARSSYRASSAPSEVGRAVARLPASSSEPLRPPTRLFATRSSSWAVRGAPIESKSDYTDVFAKPRDEDAAVHAHEKGGSDTRSTLGHASSAQVASSEMRTVRTTDVGRVHGATLEKEGVSSSLPDGGGLGGTGETVIAESTLSTPLGAWSNASSGTVEGFLSERARVSRESPPGNSSPRGMDERSDVASNEDLPSPTRAHGAVDPSHTEQGPDLGDTLNIGPDGELKEDGRVPRFPTASTEGGKVDERRSDVHRMSDSVGDGWSNGDADDWGVDDDNDTHDDSHFANEQALDKEGKGGTGGREELTRCEADESKSERGPTRPLQSDGNDDRGHEARGDWNVVLPQQDGERKTWAGLEKAEEFSSSEDSYSDDGNEASIAETTASDFFAPVRSPDLDQESPKLRPRTESPVSFSSLSPLSGYGSTGRRERKSAGRQTADASRSGGALGISPYKLADVPPLFPPPAFPRTRRASAGGLPPPVPAYATAAAAATAGAAGIVASSAERPLRSAWRSLSPARAGDYKGGAWSVSPVSRRSTDSERKRDMAPRGSASMGGVLGAPADDKAGADDGTGGLSSLPLPRAPGRGSGRPANAAGVARLGQAMAAAPSPRSQERDWKSQERDHGQACPVGAAPDALPAEVTVREGPETSRERAKSQVNRPENSIVAATGPPPCSADEQHELEVACSAETASCRQDRLSPEVAATASAGGTSAGSQTQSVSLAPASRDGALGRPPASEKAVHAGGTIRAEEHRPFSSLLPNPDPTGERVQGSADAPALRLEAEETSTANTSVPGDGDDDGDTSGRGKGPAVGGAASRASTKSAAEKSDAVGRRTPLMSLPPAPRTSAPLRPPPLSSQDIFAPLAGEGGAVTTQPSPFVNTSSPITRGRGEASLFGGSSYAAGSEASKDHEARAQSVSSSDAADLFAADAPPRPADELFSVRGPGRDATVGVGKQSPARPAGGSAEADVFSRDPPAEAPGSPPPVQSLPNPWGSSPLKEPLPEPKRWPTKAGTGFDTRLPTPLAKEMGPAGGNASAAGAPGDVPAAFCDSSGDAFGKGEGVPGAGGGSGTADSGAFRAPPASFMPSTATARRAASASVSASGGPSRPWQRAQKPSALPIEGADVREGSTGSKARPVAHSFARGFAGSGGGENGAGRWPAGGAAGGESPADRGPRDPSIKPPGVIAVFGFGGQLVCMHPRRKMKLAPAPGVVPPPDDGAKLSKGPVNVWLVKDVLRADEIMSDADSFPGPANDASSDKIVQHLEQKASRALTEGEKLLWNVVALALKFKGHLTSAAGAADPKSPEAAVVELLKAAYTRRRETHKEAVLSPLPSPATPVFGPRRSRLNSGSGGGGSHVLDPSAASPGAGPATPQVALMRPGHRTSGSAGGGSFGNRQAFQAAITQPAMNTGAAPFSRAPGAHGGFDSSGPAPIEAGEGEGLGLGRREEVEALLVDGKKEEAVEASMRAGLWGLALLIAAQSPAASEPPAGADKDAAPAQAAYQRVARLYANKFLLSGTPLHTLALLFSGQGGGAIKHGGKSLAGAAGDRGAGYGAFEQSWMATAAAIVSNKVPGWAEQLIGLGDRLMDSDDVPAAHALFLTAGMQVELPTISGARLVLPGVDHRNAAHRALRTREATDAVHLLEVLDAAWKNDRGRSNAVQGHKLRLAMRLADLGYVKKAHQYVLSVQASVAAMPGRPQGSGDQRSPYSPQFVAALHEFEDRLCGALGTSASEAAAKAGHAGAGWKGRSASAAAGSAAAGAGGWLLNRVTNLVKTSATPGPAPATARTTSASSERARLSLDAAQRASLKAATGAFPAGMRSSLPAPRRQFAHQPAGTPFAQQRPPHTQGGTVPGPGDPSAERSPDGGAFRSAPPLDATSRQHSPSLIGMQRPRPPGVQADRPPLGVSERHAPRHEPVFAEQSDGVLERSQSAASSASSNTAMTQGSSTAPGIGASTVAQRLLTRGMPDKPAGPGMPQVRSAPILQADGAEATTSVSGEERVVEQPLQEAGGKEREMESEGRGRDGKERASESEPKRDAKAKGKDLSRRASAGQAVAAKPGRLAKMMSKWLYPDAKHADVGNEMEAFYDEKTKRWVFPGEDPGEAAAAAPVAPPTASELSGPKAATTEPAATPGLDANDPLAALMAPPPASIGAPRRSTMAGGGGGPPAMGAGPPPRGFPPPGGYNRPPGGPPHSAGARGAGVGPATRSPFPVAGPFAAFAPTVAGSAAGKGADDDGIGESGSGGGSGPSTS